MKEPAIGTPTIAEPPRGYDAFSGKDQPQIPAHLLAKL